jgi:hypothetical protein
MRSIRLQGWTIYDHPSDYPQSFVARRWVVVDGEVVPTTDMFTADTLVELRAMLPPGLICFQRSRDDDSAIVECWI